MTQYDQLGNRTVNIGGVMEASSDSATAYLHEHTRIAVKEGLLVDTGAVGNLTGASFIRSIG